MQIGNELGSPSRINRIMDQPEEILTRCGTAGLQESQSSIQD